MLPAVVIVNAPDGIRTSMCALVTGGAIVAIAAVPLTTVIKPVGAIVVADAIVAGSRLCRTLHSTEQLKIKIWHLLIPFR